MAAIEFFKFLYLIMDGGTSTNGLLRNFSKTEKIVLCRIQ